MTAISTAVGTERKSRTSGYKIKKGFFDNDPANLPQIIAVFGEANTANQSGLSTVKKEITSAKEAAELYGYGSPLHQMFRILRPVSGDGVGGIPTIAFPQAEAGGATATAHEWTVTGTATANATHTIVIAGRGSLDFLKYSFAIVKGDTATVIAGKIKDAINGVLGSPVTAANVAGVLTITTKWKGVTSANLKSTIDLGTNAAGVSYSKTATTDGAGAADLSGALAQMGDVWYTVVVNPYGAAAFDDLEAFNGRPDADNPTGRYEGSVFKPFMAFFGSVLDDKDDIVAITNDSARIEEVTNVLCPAPKSEGFPWEAAANAARLFARTMQDTPHLDINNMAYPDMPVPSNGIIGDMADYNNRDLLVKNGASTVVLENDSYKVQDFVTTYHPEGENPLQYAYARNLNLDWNVSDNYRTLEKLFVKDHVLIRDGQVTDVAKAIKPIEWKGIVQDLFVDLAVKALINDPDFSKESLRVEIDGTNPDRFNTFFRYKRTGIARIESTDVEAGF
ncbi:phage tail sheath gpL-like [Thalassospira sp. 11-3]|nr:phage tail sheath gpL-like [Thalassospira sp. 11-3]